MGRVKEPRLRPARPSDLPAVVGLVRRLAEFEKLAPPSASAARRYRRDGFGRRPYFRILVAEQGRRLVGYAFYFFTYSTFRARPTLYLEDLFVVPEERGRGTGERLLRALGRVAARAGCGRMEWAVLDWNVEAQRFYRRLGARPQGAWRLWRLDGPALGRLGVSETHSQKKT
jgi:GNAT superfamily N-acetyltransferase